MLSIDQYRYISLIEQVELESEIFNHFLQEDYLEMNGIQLESSANNIVKSVLVWAQRVLNAIKKFFTNIVKIIASKINDYSTKYGLINECKKIINQKKDDITSLTLVDISSFIDYDYIVKKMKVIQIGKDSVLNVIDFAKGKNEKSQLKKMELFMHKVYDEFVKYSNGAKYLQLISSYNDLDSFYHNCNFIQNDYSDNKNIMNKCVVSDIYRNVFPSVYEDAIKSNAYSNPKDNNLPICTYIFKYITNFRRDKMITIEDEKSLKNIEGILKDNNKRMDLYRIELNKINKYIGDINILINQLDKSNEGLDENLIHIYIQAIDHYTMNSSSIVSEFFRIISGINNYFCGALEQFISINKDDNREDSIMGSNDETYGYNMDKYIVK